MKGKFASSPDRLEAAILMDVLGLHPLTLTLDELKTRFSDQSEVAVMDAVRELVSRGLIRADHNAIAPTFAATSFDSYTQCV